uniref:hypothetical protein n=1 Tax=Rhodococcus zopfii TaxID=43772 RepID=UPI001EE11DCC
RDRSHPHLGSCSLNTARLVPQAIHGTYFTDRYTQGEMDLRLLAFFWQMYDRRRAGGHPITGSSVNPNYGFLRQPYPIR